MLRIKKSENNFLELFTGLSFVAAFLFIYVFATSWGRDYFLSISSAIMVVLFLISIRFISKKIRDNSGEKKK